MAAPGAGCDQLRAGRGRPHSQRRCRSWLRAASSSTAKTGSSSTTTLVSCFMVRERNHNIDADPLIARGLNLDLNQLRDALQHYRLSPGQPIPIKQDITADRRLSSAHAASCAEQGHRRGAQGFIRGSRAHRHRLRRRGPAKKCSATTLRGLNAGDVVGKAGRPTTSFYAARTALVT